MICSECYKSLSKNDYERTLAELKFPFCNAHEEWYKVFLADYSQTVAKLYFKLRERKIKARIEKYDGFKKIDISIPSAKINLEIDGLQHSLNPKQALSDLQRNFYSFKKGYTTIHLPNKLVEHSLDDVVSYIEKFVKHSYKTLGVTIH